MTKKRNLYQKMRPPNFTTFFYFVGYHFLFTSLKKSTQIPRSSPLCLQVLLATPSFLSTESTVTCIEPVDKSNQNEKKRFRIFAFDRGILRLFSFPASNTAFFPFLPSSGDRSVNDHNSKNQQHLRKQGFPVKTKTYALIYTIWIFWRKFRRSEVQFQNPKFDFKKKTHPCRKQFTQKFSQQFSKFNPKIQLLEFTQITSCSIYPSRLSLYLSPIYTYVSPRRAAFQIF